MRINKLEQSVIEKLNEHQKYFYVNLLSFIQELDCNHFSEIEILAKKDKKCNYFIEFNLLVKNRQEIDVTIHIDYSQIIIDLAGWHENINFQRYSKDDLFQTIKSFLVFALSKNCKIIIYKSNNFAYKWDLYALENNSWRFYSTTRLFIYNFFGKKTMKEKVSSLFQDSVIPKDFFMTYC